MFVTIDPLQLRNAKELGLTGKYRVKFMSSQPISGRATGAMPFEKYTAFQAVDLPDRQWPSKGSSVKPPTNRVFGIRPNTALNRNYRPGRILEDGRVASVTTISGLAVHSHGAYGKDWEGAIFSMSPGTNTVGAFLPEKPFPASDQYVHQLYPDAVWKEREFLASTDERFRPVNASMGPDGCLYVVDFYRGVIQHKRFLTSYLRNQSAERKLDKPIGLGRIYRIVPEDHVKVDPPKDLVAGLSHPYLWWRLRSQKSSKNWVVEKNE